MTKETNSPGELFPGMAELLEHGLLGGLLVIAILAIIFLYREIRAINAARTADIEQASASLNMLAHTLEANGLRLREAIELFTKTMKENGNVIDNNSRLIDNNSRLIETRMHAEERTDLVIERQLNELTRIQEEVRGLLHHISRQPMAMVRPWENPPNSP